MRSARIAAIGFSLLLAFPGLSSISALDLREIDEHLEYLDRPLVSFYSKPMQIEGEPYLYSLIGVIATLEEALVDRPDDVQILRRLGDAYRISAATDIDKLLRSVEDRPHAEFRVPHWSRRTELAKEYLEKARSLAPRDPEIYAALGRTFGFSRDELKKAVAYFERAMALSGRSPSPDLLMWLAYVYGETRQPERTIETIEAYLKLYPADWGLLQIYMRAGMAALARNTKRFPREHSLIFLPADYDPNRRYPVLVDLQGLVTAFGYPFTGRPVSLGSYDAEAVKTIRFDAETGSQRSLIILIPMNFDKGQDFSTWEGFSSLIETCEQRVLSDLEKIEQWYSVDTSRVGLCGFSIGADLSWALSNRYPEVFCGAVVHGSRCGYIDKARIRELTRNDSRLYLTIAGDDLPARVNGMENAKRLLDEAGVENVYVKKETGGHNVGVLDLEAAVDYLFFE